jgi:hypothetical protein
MYQRICPEIREKLGLGAPTFNERSKFKNRKLKVDPRVARQNWRSVAIDAMQLPHRRDGPSAPYGRNRKIDGEEERAASALPFPHLNPDMLVSRIRLT